MMKSGKEIQIPSNHAQQVGNYQNCASQPETDWVPGELSTLGARMPYQMTIE